MYLGKVIFRIYFILCRIINFTFLFIVLEDDKNIREREKVSDQNWVFVSKNASTVKAHTGSTAVLPCQVKKDSLYGMVSEIKNN